MRQLLGRGKRSTVIVAVSLLALYAWIRSSPEPQDIKPVVVPPIPERDVMHKGRSWAESPPADLRGYDGPKDVYRRHSFNEKVRELLRQLNQPPG